MALTMTDEQERGDRNALFGVDRGAMLIDAQARLDRAYAELDATRARVAELERKVETMKRTLCISEPEEGMWALERALAAREVECAELRAQIAAYLLFLDSPPAILDPVSREHRSADVRAEREKLRAILSRPPGTNEALRAMLERAVQAGHADWDGDTAAIVARLLPPGDGVSADAEKEGDGG